MKKLIYVSLCVVFAGATQASDPVSRGSLLLGSLAAKKYVFDKSKKPCKSSSSESFFVEIKPLNKKDFFILDRKSNYKHVLNLVQYYPVNNQFTQSTIVDNKNILKAEYDNKDLCIDKTQGDLKENYHVKFQYLKERL